MANIFPSFVQVHPSYMVPEAIIQFQQASGAFEALAQSAPQVRLGDGDLYVYIKKFDIRTKAFQSQVAGNQLPSCSVQAQQISMPSYMVRTRAEYDHHDVAAGGKWGVGVPEAQRLGMRQATFQTMRNMLLYGSLNPANGEGLLNASGAISVSLPADSNGNNTVVTYDNGQMAIFLLSQIQALKTRTMQLGIGHRFVVLGPQRVLGAFQYQNIVQLTQFQRPGAGSATTSGTVQEIMDLNGDQIDWCYDDTLIGKGAGGTDAILIVMPEVEKPAVSGINTNEFAKLTPGLDACTLMFADMVAPREIPTPLPGGAIDVLSEMRVTPGWAVRPEALSIVSMQYQ